ncbi:MAG: cyclase family protein, partial [Bacteroidota bacterium]|nr:cyclase family protein [Bacteroidota bacterium]MDX5430589.1 cyclase family protein [Bacteroidota bacterium]MDX5469341.1 cyclase family protein [Bacteroidota bacterium]
MILQTKNGQFDLDKGFDLSIPVRRGENSVEAFYIPHAQMEPFRAGGFVGSVPEGGACNCENILFNAHGNGTHTECVGHVSKEPHYLPETLFRHFFVAELVSIQPSHQENGDYLILPEQVPNELPEAFIIRTLPNSSEKKYKKYSGTNPVYLH